MLNTINLDRVDGMWIVTYEGSHAVRIIDLFGTSSIPTAFTHVAPAEVVLKEIAWMNPDVNIVIKF